MTERDDKTLAQVWETNAADWIRWARAPGHDSYWRFHCEAFLQLVPAPGRLTLDVGCGEGRLARDLKALGHRVFALDSSPTLVRAAAEADPELDVVVAEATSLPLADRAADLAVAFMSLMDMDDCIERDGLRMTFESLHRTFADYANALTDAGFAIEAVREVTDDADPRWRRIPLFLHLRAKRGNASQPG
jgi:SAM-dependent methyltransferase